ncbi:MAG: MATE family efflux transporter [Actinobacteria bacterium]|nr:MATE family efflux transporter [Actinomycetota bacterium]
MTVLRSPYDGPILRLAVPSLGALIAEPLFLATDTALVGHLGAGPLAALGVASTVLQTALGLLIFLAYATTPLVARRLGAGDSRGALHAGIDGMWLAAGLGVVLAVVGWVAGPWLTGLFGAEPDVAAAAARYLRISCLGLPAMLVVVAATGLFRGLLDTRTPLVVAGLGFAANAGLNALLIYPAGLGLDGSAVGTVLAQTGMAAACVVIAVRHARRGKVGLRPGRVGLLATARSGGWLFLRNLSMRIVLVATVVAATAHGTVALAATQAVFTVFGIAALGLDALAIAGQAMIGHALGAGDGTRARAVLTRLLQLAGVGGLALGLALAAVSGPLAAVFTSDGAVRAAIAVGLGVVALGLPVGGVVWALDGVLMGAGDNRYLALAGAINLVVTLPALLWLMRLPMSTTGAVAAIWLVFAVGYLVVRLVTLSTRARDRRWMVLGV